MNKIGIVKHYAQHTFAPQSEPQCNGCFGIKHISREKKTSTISISGLEIWRLNFCTRQKSHNKISSFVFDVTAGYFPCFAAVCSSELHRDGVTHTNLYPVCVHAELNRATVVARLDRLITVPVYKLRQRFNLLRGACSSPLW